MKSKETLKSLQSAGSCWCVGAFSGWKQFQSAEARANKKTLMQILRSVVSPGAGVKSRIQPKTTPRWAQEHWWVQVGSASRWMQNQPHPYITPIITLPYSIVWKIQLVINLHRNFTNEWFRGTFSSWKQTWRTDILQQEPLKNAVGSNDLYLSSICENQDCPWLLHRKPAARKNAVFLQEETLSRTRLVGSRGRRSGGRAEKERKRKTTGRYRYRRYRQSCVVSSTHLTHF